MSSKPDFTLYTCTTGPNGWKCVFVLLALDLSFESIYIDIKAGEHKRAPYTDLNPNGRLPTLVDHQTGVVVWESDAILLYLAEEYDPEGKVSNKDVAGKYKQLQMLFFQGTGQGPYFGQAAWFKLFHPLPLPSAISRYEAEVVRILAVLESVLSRSRFVAGDKVTVADLSFVTWNNFALKALLPASTNFSVDFPLVSAWHSCLLELPYVKEGLGIRSQVAEH
ncbi:glutathione S-transferase C-terminal-like protein [Meredithblackwellia eburnea MCA 4105]